MAKKAASSKESTKSKVSKGSKKSEEKKPEVVNDANPKVKSSQTVKTDTAKVVVAKKKSDDFVSKVKTAKVAMTEKTKGSKEVMKETTKEVKEKKNKKSADEAKPKAIKEPKTPKKPKKVAASAAEVTETIQPPVIEIPVKRTIALTKKYGKEDLDYFRELILNKRSEIVRQIQNLQEQMKDPTTGEYINENSPYSLHMAEQGTDAMEREKTYLYIQRETKFLTYLDDALERIDAGTYGVCIECIDEPKNLCPTCPLISKQRLEAVPHSKLCVEIKKRQEKVKRY